MNPESDLELMNLFISISNQSSNIKSSLELHTDKPNSGGPSGPKNVIHHFAQDNSVNIYCKLDIGRIDHRES